MLSWIKANSPCKNQIWLKEKLGVLMPPANPATYRPRQFQARGHVLAKVERAVLEVPGGWTNFLLSRNEESICWHCPWWKLSFVTTSVIDNCVQIASFGTVTFYTPLRVCRQYGKVQRILHPVPFFTPYAVTPFFLREIRSRWASRSFVRNLSFTQEPTTDDEYKAWVELVSTTAGLFTSLQT